MEKQKSNASFSFVVSDCENTPAPKPDPGCVEEEKNLKKLLEEMEQRKHQFWQLIDEHKAVVQKLKTIEERDPKKTS